MKHWNNMAIGESFYFLFKNKSHILHSSQVVALTKGPTYGHSKCWKQMINQKLICLVGFPRIRACHGILSPVVYLGVKGPLISEKEYGKERQPFQGESLFIIKSAITVGILREDSGNAIKCMLQNYHTQGMGAGSFVPQLLAILVEGYWGSQGQ